MRGFIMAMMAVWALAATPDANFAAEFGGKKTKIINSDGQEIGEATVTESSSGVLIRLQLQRHPAKIAAGAHAFHIHEVGECAPPFKSAGAHWNPTKKKHGFLDKQGAHVGDLPNIHVPENSPLTVEMVIPQVSLSGGKTSLIRRRRLCARDSPRSRGLQERSGGRFRRSHRVRGGGGLEEVARDGGA